MKLQLHCIIFISFFSDETLKTVVDSTNLYSVQKSGVSINTNKEEIIRFRSNKKKFIGLQIIMRIIQLPNYQAYWFKNTGITQIADKMPVNCFEKLRQYFHFVDNNLGNSENDKLFKVKPILDDLRAECVKIEPDTKYSM